MKILNDITEFIFVEDSVNEITDADIIFIPGSSKYQLPELGSRLYSQGLAKTLLPSGRYSSKNNKFSIENTKDTRYEGIYETEWDFCKHVLMKNGVPEKQILKEDESTNTYENALFSKKVLDENNIKIKKAILVCQAFHARRVLMTYSVVFPNVDFYVCPIDTQGVNKNNWFENEYGIKRVLGEVEKCGKYFNVYLNELLIKS